MKRALLTGVGLAALALALQPSLAADMPTKAPMYKAAVAPVFNWTGFYAGAQAGYGWGQSEHFDLAFSYGDLSISGAAFGGTMGFNWQVSPVWLFGVEADFSWSNIKGTENDLPACSCITDVDWFGTARARAGVVNGQSLFYVTGGVAYAKIYSFSNLPDNGTVKRAGWTAGAGMEHAFASNWSAKLEYLYADFGHYTYDNVPAVDNYSAKTHFHFVRFGVNYRFATGAMPAAIRN
jgi:outer membrane immunogenic protein